MIKNPTFTLWNVAKRLCFPTATLNSITRREMCNSSLGSIRSNDFDQTEHLNPVFGTSLKSYIRSSHMNIFHEYNKNVNFIRSTYSFVIDEDVARDIVEKISTRTDFTKTIIIEGNAGLGLITQNLLNYDIPLQYVFDSSQLVKLSLQQIIKEHSDRIILKRTNINKNADHEILIALDKANKMNLGITIILITTAFYFFRFIVILFLKNGLWKSKCDIYAVLTNQILKSIMNISPLHFRYLYYCAFNLLFVTEKISSYPANAFLPKSATEKFNEPNDFSLVKFSVNPNIFSNFDDEEELKDYIIFITILSTSSYNSIIPTLEKWLPDCGPYLINKGISMTNKVIDFSHQESITLFKIFKQCEGYKYFKISVNNAFESSTIG